MSTFLQKSLKIDKIGLQKTAQNPKNGGKRPKIRVTYKSYIIIVANLLNYG